MQNLRFLIQEHGILFVDRLRFMPKYCFFLLLAKVAIFVLITASLVVYAQVLSLKVTFASKLLTGLIWGIFYIHVS